MARMEDRPMQNEPGVRILGRPDWIVCIVIAYLLTPNSASPLSDAAHWLRYAGTLILVFSLWIPVRIIYSRINKKHSVA